MAYIILNDALLLSQLSLMSIWAILEYLSKSVLNFSFSLIFTRYFFVFHEECHFNLCFILYLYILLYYNFIPTYFFRFLSCCVLYISKKNLKRICWKANRRLPFFLLAIWTDMQNCFHAVNIFISWNHLSHNIISQKKILLSLIS